MKEQHYFCRRYIVICYSFVVCSSKHTGGGCAVLWCLISHAQASACGRVSVCARTWSSSAHTCYRGTGRTKPFRRGRRLTPRHSTPGNPPSSVSVRIKHNRRGPPAQVKYETQMPACTRSSLCRQSEQSPLTQSSFNFHEFIFIIYQTDKEH